MSVTYKIFSDPSNDRIWINRGNEWHCTGATAWQLGEMFCSADNEEETLSLFRDEIISHSDSLEWIAMDIDGPLSPAAQPVFTFTLDR